MKRPKLSTLNHQYKNVGDKLTPFEIYLKYSTEKDISIKQLNNILSQSSNSVKILDIGCGDGSYLLESIPKDSNFEITFLEPSIQLFNKLEKNIQGHENYNSINKTFEEFNLENKEVFDIVLASHLYHFSQSEYPIFLSQLISLLEDSGTLIWIERGIDEITDFKKRFKSKLLPDRYPKDWEPRNYKKALEILKEKSADTELVLNRSVLKFPYKENLDEVMAIVEFYLNIDWTSIPIEVQNEILKYIEEKKGILKQEEGVIIYKKK